MKNTKYIIPALALPALALTLLGAGVASAHGGWQNIDPATAAKNQETRFENEASMLGISVTELKNNWAQGKNIQDIAKEKGISEADLKAKIEAQMKEHRQARLKALVDAGVITQSQADQRLQFESTHKPQMHGRGGEKMGMHRGMFGGPGDQGQAKDEQPVQN